MPIELPRRHHASLLQLASTVLERRGPIVDHETLASELLAGFAAICLRAGLDRVLADLARAFTSLDTGDLAHDDRLRAALLDMLGTKSAYDARGPRATKLTQLADCLIAVLSLTLVDEPERTVTLADSVRVQVVAALSGVIDVELANERLREAVIANARARLEPAHHAAFDRLAPHLDERAARLLRQPKIPLDAVQAVQRALHEARSEIVRGAARTALERAHAVIAGADATLAARIDQPITLALTPRDVALDRADDARMAGSAANVVHALFDALTELLEIAWIPPAETFRPYAASATFAVGDHIEHPKFGRGTVVGCAVQRIDVEFEDAKHTLVHARK